MSTSTDTEKLLWQPSEDLIANTALKHFIDSLRSDTKEDIEGYWQLHAYSVSKFGAERFWQEVWDFCEIVGDPGHRIIEEGRHITKTAFFPDAEFNYAENLLAGARYCAPTDPAIIFRAEDKLEENISWAQLYAQVAGMQNFLREQGIQHGDRVAGFVSHCPAAVVGMLATTSLGAIWTSCSPDFGENAVIERFGQVAPACLIATEAYYYQGKVHDCRQKIQKICQSIDSIKTLVVAKLATVDSDSEMTMGIENTHSYEQIVQSVEPAADGKKLVRINFVLCPFEHPLFIMYSSGTTGMPKCIVHKMGGVLLEHVKEHKLHCDIKPGDRVFYFTTCGWMMWNWQVSALASGATLVLYDGSPFYPNQDSLFAYAEQSEISLFGTAAKYLEVLGKSELDIQSSYKLEKLRMICSTGSPLLEESFEYVYTKIKQDVHLASISGGTDIVGCFMMGVPILPVYAGQIQAPGLGMDIDVFDEHGNSVTSEKGELVCKNATPSMPLCFWNDPGRHRYLAAYFSGFADVWTHGDYLQKTAEGGYVIYGRSDATLNPGGVRIGTAEIYRQLYGMEQIQDALAVGQKHENDVRLVLFVVLVADKQLDDALVAQINKSLKENCSPRYVPALILQVSDVPRTRSGKITELAITAIFNFEPVKNENAIANLECLEQYRKLAKEHIK